MRRTSPVAALLACAVGLLACSSSDPPTVRADPTLGVTTTEVALMAETATFEAVKDD